MSDWLPLYVETLEIQYRRFEQIQKTINFLLGCLMESCNISRGSKLNSEALSKFKRQLLLTRMFDWLPLYVQTLEIQYRSFEQIQMKITFYSDVWLSPVVYRDARTWMPMLGANSNENNFLLVCLIQSRNISRRSKLNVETLSKF